MSGSLVVFLRLLCSHSQVASLLILKERNQPFISFYFSSPLALGVAISGTPIVDYEQKKTANHMVLHVGLNSLSSQRQVIPSP